MTAKSRLLNFLLVEDDTDHAYLVRRSMERARLTNSLAHVSDGMEAILYLKGEGQYRGRVRPDLILLDLKLPKVDGHEVLAHVKNSPDLKTIPVVILTTSDAETDRAKAYEHHANSYIVKPLDGEGFRAVIEHLNLYWGVVDVGPPSAEPAG